MSNLKKQILLAQIRTANNARNHVTTTGNRQAVTIYKATMQAINNLLATI